MKRASARALIFLAAICSTSATCADVLVHAEVAAAPVLDDRYPRHAIDFASDVESWPDLVYSVLPGYRPLRLDVYKPKASASGGRPLVVYIHGGGWLSGHTRHAGAFANWPGVLASLAARGFVVASIEYRLSSEATFPAAVQDVKKSVRWLRSKAGDFDIDPARVLLWGGSAGGQLAALAATTCGNESLAPVLSAEEAGLQAQSDCVQGLVAWYGVFDMSTIWPSSGPPGGRNDPANNPAVKYLGCIPASCAQKAALASAAMQIDQRDPPALLIHGEIDKVVPVAQSRGFESALRAKGVAVELLVIPDVDHSFIGSSAEATRQASLTALTRTFAFIDTTLRAK